MFNSAMGAMPGPPSDKAARHASNYDQGVDLFIRRAVGPEDPGMYGVQTWSAGPIYPAIIKVVETYAEFPDDGEEYETQRRAVFYAQPLAARLISRKYVLTIPGCEPFEFDSRGAAETYALRMQGGAPYADLGLVV
ncbi:hypothetical protein UFOVP1326_21 [uncultured Caudovirales phage]|uniref:Uncharacterized protein n=1 Tax=uncultured Caudovirales phage TaxID=2100421 RepID=A0A6J5SEA3_9CAUD|nr:hypothetical protein UFOVP1326_21 [uncultured Caudovirales phage]CAB4212542.1 hypothetical protein UFOVP1436_18 [uncultured Caudovirales phage]